LALISAFFVTGYFSSSAIAQPIGTLKADRLSLAWIPVSGDLLTGSLKGGALGQPIREGLAQVFLPEGIQTPAGTTPASGVFTAVIAADAEVAGVLFESSTTGAVSGALWSSRHAATVPAGEPWLGDIVCFDAGVTVEGEVIGNVIAIGGDVTIAPGATVRGDVVVFGGVLRQQQDAKIYGRVFAPGGHRRPRLPVPASISDLAGEEKWRPTFSYDRVDGLRLGGGGVLRNQTGTTRLQLWAGYAVASQTGQFELRLRQRLDPSGVFDLLAAAFRVTDTDDEAIVHRDENSVFALGAGSDYRDYFGADGFEIGIAGKYHELGSARLTYQFHDYRWMDAEPGLWHVFRRGHDFRTNFWSLGEDFDGEAVLDNASSALHLSARLAPVSSDEHPIGFNGSLSLTYEVAGGLLGGDYEYDRIILEGQGWWDVTRWHRLKVRAIYGGGRHALPPNKLFYAGGLGTLRGFPHKDMVGDELVLGNVEYEFTYWENPFGDAAVILLFDFGRATFDGDLWDVRELKSDVGVGLDFGESIRLDVAKRLDRDHGDIKISLRLSKPF